MITRRILFIVIGVLAIVITAILGWNAWRASIAQKTEIRLGKNQTDAAVSSGKDAVGTLINRADADRTGDQTVEGTKDAIRNANDAGAVTDAGRAGLCALAGYSERPECLQRAPTK